ncbi:MAG: S24 family peptidase [Eubacteriaceae bacterium]|jgi:hypothetical protein
MLKNGNVKLFNPSEDKPGATLGSVTEQPEGSKILISVQDWSMCEPFNKDDVVQIVRSNSPRPGEPVLVEAEGKLILCILRQDEGDTVCLSFTGEQEHEVVPAENIRIIGTASGILRS